MAQIFFTVDHRFEASARELWMELTDWSRHGDWIPATRMDVEPGDPRRVGAAFVAYSGYWPLVLEDRMTVSQIDWDGDAQSGTCEVTKHGPVLTGRAGFTIAPDGAGSTIEWVEDVEVARVPGFLVPVVAKAGAFGFKMGMRGLAKKLAATEPLSA
jgi:hypothetical protein